MPLIPVLKCALCRGPIDALSAFFRANGDFLSKRDPLVQFCNAVFHWTCYGQWPERHRFASAYVRAWIDANRKNPFWWSVYRDEHVYVSVNPLPPVEEASVRLMQVGTDIRVPLAQWSAWLAEVDRVTPNLQRLEKESLMAVLPYLQEKFPDDHSVVHAIESGEKQAECRSSRSLGSQDARARIP